MNQYRNVLVDLSGVAVTDSGPSVYCMDDTKPDGSHPAIMAFVLADKSRDMANLTTKERKQRIIEHLAETFKCKKFLEPIGYIEKNWMEEEFSGGCYSMLMCPGQLTQYGNEIRKPFGHVYFAGTETARYWSGYMEGAIESGERAANEVLCALGKISPSEIWQGEPESTDFPSEPFPEDWVGKHLPSVASCLIGIAVPVLFGVAAAAWKLFM